MYTHITLTANGADAITYALNGTTENEKGHNNHEHRNEMISSVNLIPGKNPIPQFELYWDLARKNHKYQMLRIIQSFSEKELKTKDDNGNINYDNIAVANKIGREFARRYYPHRQAMIFTQIDGESGLIHNHILISDCDMYTYKGCEKHQKDINVIRHWSDSLSSQYFKLDYGPKNGEKITRTERVKREKDEYCWKDDIRRRLDSVIKEGYSSEADFIVKCKNHGIEAEKGHFDKKDRDNFKYTLTDYSNVPPKKIPKGYRKYAIRSYRLGENYDYDAIMEHMNDKKINKDTAPVTAAENKRQESDLGTCVNDFYNYAIHKTTEKRNLTASFSADQYYQQLNKKLEENNLQINLVMMLQMILRLLNEKKDKKVYQEMLYDMIDHQRRIREEKRKIEEENRKQRANEQMQKDLERLKKNKITHVVKRGNKKLDLDEILKKADALAEKDNFEI